MKNYIKSAIRPLSDEDTATKIAIAQSPTLRKDTLWTLAKDDSWDVRYSLLSNKDLPADILAYLANDNMSPIRCRVAGHPNTSSDTLSLLIYDGSIDVRMNVAQNPNTPTEILYKLAEDSSTAVRAALVQNSRLPRNFREAIANHVGYYMYICVYFDVPAEAELRWDETDDMADSIRKRLVNSGYSIADCWVDDDLDQEDAPEGIVWYRACVHCRGIYTDDEAKQVTDVIKDQITYFDETFSPDEESFYSPEYGNFD